jgi:hypothetical protein
MIALILAALLVAMLVPAFAFGANNGTDFSASMIGTKITIQEEVGGTFTAESMTALAVPPNEAVVASTTMMISESVTSLRIANLNAIYNSPLAGKECDGLFARHY